MKKCKKIMAFFLALALGLNMLSAGKMVVRAEETDVEAPVITFLEKITEDPIYTGTPLEYKVSYEDDQSSVESIYLTYVNEDGEKLTGELYYDWDYSEDTEDIEEDMFGQSAEKKILSLSLDSSTRVSTGKLTLKSVEISDVFGNTRCYSDEDPEGQRTYTLGDNTARRMAETDDDETISTTWAEWKASCGFERVLYKNGLEVTGISFESGLKRNAVAPGTKFDVYVTVKNNSEDDYPVGYSQISWDDTLNGDGYIWVSQEQELVIKAGESGTIVISVPVEKDALIGKRILEGLFISGSFEEYMGPELMLDRFGDGNYYAFYDSNLTGTFKPDADFTVGIPVSPATPSNPVVQVPTAVQNPVRNTVTEIINTKLKGTKISSLKAAKKKMVVTWKKQTKKTKGYQIQYSTSKKFDANVKVKTINGTKKTSVTLKGLKSKKTYYVRIRTWQKTAGGKAYSTWSKAKKVKVK